MPSAFSVSSRPHLQDAETREVQNLAGGHLPASLVRLRNSHLLTASENRVLETEELLQILKTQENCSDLHINPFIRQLDVVNADDLREYRQQSGRLPVLLRISAVLPKSKDRRSPTGRYLKIVELRRHGQQREG